MRTKTKGGYEIDVDEDIYSVYVWKGGKIVASFLPQQLAKDKVFGDKWGVKTPLPP